MGEAELGEEETRMLLAKLSIQRGPIGYRDNLVQMANEIPEDLMMWAQNCPEKLYGYFLEEMNHVPKIWQEKTKELVVKIPREAQIYNHWIQRIITQVAGAGIPIQSCYLTIIYFLIALLEQHDFKEHISIIKISARSLANIEDRTWQQFLQGIKEDRIKPRVAIIPLWERIRCWLGLGK